MSPLEWILAITMSPLALGAAFFILVIAFKMVREHLEKHQ